MSRRPTRMRDPWEDLLRSEDAFSDLCDLYSAEFFEGFASHFNRNPMPFDLFKGVLNTAQAFMRGKWDKKVEYSKLLQYSGVHLIGAGMSARRLSYELRQITKSDRASQMLHLSLEKILDQSETLPRAKKVYRSIEFRNGPQSRLSAIRELASALEEALGNIIELPSKYDEETDAAQRAFDFVSTSNSAAEKLLSKNHAVEEAARAFKPQWEAFSSVAYRRGRFNDRLGVYNCQAGDALHLIIAKLDSKVALSLAGTAIKNVEINLKV
jgi:SAM-dependent methyltransferase